MDASEQIIFAFDFSMIKPAMSAYINGNIEFHLWPAHLDSVSTDRLSMFKVNIHDRNLQEMKANKYNEDTLILEHVTRAQNLANEILKTINEIISRSDSPVSKEDVIIANEGFAFSAKGNAVLDLSGYKYILMQTLINDGFRKFRTFSPITIKKTADCSKRGLGKDAMIDALGNQTGHVLFEIIKEHPEYLKKKSSYVTGLDDIADSYWCLRTAIENQN